MKTLVSLLLILSFRSTYANTQKCSNSDGSVNWEVNHDESEVRLKYSNFIEGILFLDINEIQINFQETKILDEKTAKDCTQIYGRRVFASKITITPGVNSPDVLSSHFPENQILTEVICTETTKRETLPQKNNAKDYSIL